MLSDFQFKSKIKNAELTIDNLIAFDTQTSDTLYLRYYYKN